MFTALFGAALLTGLVAVAFLPEIIADAEGHHYMVSPDSGIGHSIYPDWAQYMNRCKANEATQIFRSVRAVRKGSEDITIPLSVMALRGSVGGAQ